MPQIVKFVLLAALLGLAVLYGQRILAALTAKVAQAKP